MVKVHRRESGMTSTVIAAEEEQLARLVGHLVPWSMFVHWMPHWLHEDCLWTPIDWEVLAHLTESVPLGFPREAIDLIVYPTSAVVVPL